MIKAISIAFIVCVVIVDVLLIVGCHILEERRNNMRALYKAPTDTGFHEIVVQNKLEKLQELVGGYIETVTMTMDSCLIVNEEGRILGLPHNCNYLGIDVCGPMLIVGVNGDEFTDVPLSVVMANKGIVK